MQHPVKTGEVSGNIEPRKPTVSEHIRKRGLVLYQYDGESYVDKSGKLSESDSDSESESDEIGSD